MMEHGALARYGPRLSFVLAGSYGNRYTVADGKKLRLEDRLNWVMEKFIERSEKAKKRRQAMEEADRKRRALEEQREKKLRLIHAEEARVAELTTEIKAWGWAGQIRAYLRAVEEAVVARNGRPVREGSEMALWLEWGEQQANRADPLAHSEPSILDEKAKWERAW